jgi:hypothetical protein
MRIKVTGSRAPPEVHRAPRELAGAAALRPFPTGLVQPKISQKKPWATQGHQPPEHHLQGCTGSCLAAWPLKVLLAGVKVSARL